jgi:hypothetical protein
MINENDTNIMLCSPNLADLPPLLMPNAINIYHAALSVAHYSRILQTFFNPNDA